MLPTRTPMGFIAILGVVALAGMMLRPILLTAAAAILGMLPIARDVFWGPMAFAVIGGLAGATLLTLLFLPALYVGSAFPSPARRQPRNPSAHPQDDHDAGRLALGQQCTHAC
jgi:multidrug efflux pump subunit AcrB